jgi:uncharacterized BrkB/YihY/UPF0761 family membrane protein
MLTFTVLPTLIIITFLIVTLYKHFIKKQPQNLKDTFRVTLFFAVVWGLIYYLAFS